MDWIDLAEGVIGILGEHRCERGLTTNSLQYLRTIPLEDFLAFLQRVEATEPGRERPEYPNQGSFGSDNTPLIEYKSEMNAYIKEWGYQFPRWSFMPSTLYEATANYLESLS